MTLFPANPINAFGSAMVISAKEAKEAETPPVVGSVSTAIYNPFSLNLAKAWLVFAIWNKEITPSCILAPPGVVNRINEIMDKAFKEVGGTRLYVNTDGFIVKNPVKLIKHSTELGEFKLEHSGDVYIYVDKNYFIIQAGQELKGNCMCMVRDKFDLPNGKVVHYNKVRKVIKDATINDSEVSILVADNIIEDKVEVYDR